MPPSAVAIALPDPEFDAVRDELAAAGFEPIRVETADDLEKLLGSRKDVDAAILDWERDFDLTLVMYALLHGVGRSIPALMLVPPLTLARMTLGGRSDLTDEYLSRPFSADTVRWRVEALVIRVENIPAEAVAAEGPAADQMAADNAATDDAAAEEAPTEDTQAIAIEPAFGPVESIIAEAVAVAAAADAAADASYNGPGPIEAVEGAPAGRAIIVFNPKGGVGKTTVAINLGAALQLRKHQRVLLIDCDTVTGHIASSLGLGQLRTLSEAWIESDRVGATDSIEQAAAHHPSGVDVIVLSSTPFHTEVLVPARVAEAVAAARSLYDIVILDLHPDFGPLNLALFDLADRMLVPVTPDVPCILAAVQFREVASALQIRERLFMVINRANSGVAPSRVERTVALPTLARIRSAGMLFNLAAGEGKSAVERSPRAKAIGDIDKLADRLLVELGAEPVRPHRRWFIRGILARLTAG